MQNKSNKMNQNKSVSLNNKEAVKSLLKKLEEKKADYPYAVCHDAAVANNPA